MNTLKEAVTTRALALGHRVANLVVIRGLELDLSAGPGSKAGGKADEPPAFEYRIATGEEAHSLVPRSGNYLTPQFVDERLDAGDRCWLALERDVVLGFAWLSSCDTPLMHDFVVTVPRGSVYLHRAYTFLEARGRGVYPKLIRAMAWDASRDGYTRLISAVDVENIAATQSAINAGQKPFGFLAVGGRLGHYLTYASPGCRERGFGLKPGHLDVSRFSLRD